MSLTTTNNFDENHIMSIRKMIGNGISDTDFAVFLHQCKRTGLDPLLKQIYCIPMGGKVNIMTSIDGARLIAERTGKYAPGSKTEFELDKNGNLISATAFVKKMTNDGTWHEVSATAYLSEYAGNSPLWKRMPRVMLEKCAEMRCLRRSFANDLSGLYAKEEMDQAEQADVEIIEDKPKLTDEQIANLENAFEGLDDYKATVMKGLKIASIADLPVGMYDQAIKRANTVREERTKKAKEQEEELPF